MPIIEWRREPHRVRIPVLILRPSPVADLAGETGTALIDTGSTVSGVALRTASSLGLTHPSGRRPRQLPDAFEFDALLGMDVLGQCDFAMNRRGACRLVFG
jgi:hypothetical protein